MVDIKKSDTIMDDPKIMSLSIADSGKGKTWFMGTIANTEKTFIIDAERGLKTIADKKFDYVEVSTWKEFLEALAWYYNNHKKERYTHLCIDSITRLQQYLALELNAEGKLTQAQWGEILAKLRVVVAKLTTTCPTSVHINAMAMESKDELSGQIKIYPNLQGSFKYDLAGYFDLVFYHDCGTDRDGKQTYWVQTQGDQRITARSRLDCLGKLPRLCPNDYSIIRKLLNSKEKTNEPS